MRKSFTFYSSYYDAISELPVNKQGKMYKALIDYAMTQKEPQLNGSEKMAFILIKPSLDKSIKQFMNGCKNSQEPNDSQTIANKEPNDSQNQSGYYQDKEIDIEIEKKEKEKTPSKKDATVKNTILADGELDILIDKSFTDPDVKAKFRDYANMRAGMGKNKAIRTRATFDGCISKIRKFAKTKQQAIDILDESITNNWTGLFELKPQPQSVEEVPFAN